MTNSETPKRIQNVCSNPDTCPFCSKLKANIKEPSVAGFIEDDKRVLTYKNTPDAASVKLAAASKRAEEVSIKANSTAFANHFPTQVSALPPILTKRTTITEPDGTKIVTEEFSTTPAYNVSSFNYPSTGTSVPCPCKDPANAGKAMGFVCQTCSPKYTANRATT